MITIPIGSDHAGYELKKYLIEQLSDFYNFEDFGTHSMESVDYTIYAHAVANAIQENDFEKGMLICGSGNGVQMAANKHKGVRAALCWNSEIARLARMHNNANILVLPGRFIDFEEAKACVSAFFGTAFEGGRHADRVKHIDIA